MERLAEPFKTLAEVVGEPYEEEMDEKRAERWLISNRFEGEG
jgi:hypothetical protein